MPASRNPLELEELFHRAAGLRGEERAAFLEEHCSGGVAMRRQLAALLRQHDQGTKDYLGEHVVAAGPDETPPTTVTPDVIGRYHVLEPIGEGGMGTVYRAEQREPVRRKVALKVIKLGMDTQRVVKRFEAESQTLAIMNHPGIARILDAGTTDSGRPYFVMELVDGQPLTAFCDERNLTIEKRLRLFQRVCEAIQHAHHKGVIHRDLKPSNILVTVQDGSAQPKVIDFGIARATADDSGGHQTLQSEVIGTFDYMSPEQTEPGQAHVDARSDIYALGAILYELLTGALPFGEDALHEKALADVQAILRDKEVTPPSTQITRLQGRAAGRAEDVSRSRSTDVASIRRKLRGDLDWIVLKALDKDPTRRYSSASELAADIERHLHDAPVLASPPGRIYRLTKFARRNRLAVTAAGLVVLALLVGGTGTVLGYLEAKENEKKARKSVRRALESERRAKASEERARLKAVEAERARKVAQEHLENFTRLADIGTIRRLVNQRGRLPAYRPAHLPELDRWFREAAAVRSRRRRHEAARDALRAAEAELTAADAQLLRNLEALIKVYERLERVHRKMTRRRTHVRELVRRTLEEPRAAWDRAVAAIADRHTSPKYDGLEIKPQLGLVPLGPDPDSGLWEFAHVASGTVPERTAEGHLVRDAGTGLVFVLIPGGEFTMGARPPRSGEPASTPNVDPYCDRAEGPPHVVALDPFLLSKYEITGAQWLRLEGATGGPLEVVAGLGWRPPMHPLDTMNHGRATFWLKSAGLVLPTEAQWEYAARGGTGTVWWSGNDPAKLPRVANMLDRSAVGTSISSDNVPRDSISRALDDGFPWTAPIGSFPANAFGLHDVLGNVAEHVQEEPVGYDRPPRPGDGLRTPGPGVTDSGYRILRGGSCLSEPRYTRSAYRWSYAMRSTLNWFGVRPVWVLDR